MMTPTLNELPEGTIVGKWKIGRLLGRGGQGAVWSAKPTTTKRGPQRALKACFSAHAKDRARFEREIELLRLCSSPFVLSLLDADPEWVDRVPGVPPFAYHVAEQCEGSLKDRQYQFGDARSRLSLFQAACKSVMHLHSLPDPIIHRDIKPANFLLAKEPRRLVLADFGIARQEVAESSLTATQEVVGSRFFRAPEILNGDSGSVRSDVYSLGRLLEWLLTGDVSTDLGTRPVPRDGQLADEACDALDRVIAKATQAIPGNRFGSVAEVADAVPGLWLSLKPRPSTEPVVSSVDATSVLPAALELARTNNGVGWRQLEGQLRRAYPDRVKTWRVENERAPAKNWDELSKAVDRLVEAVMGRLVFALAGVFSQHAALVDQRRVVEDLVSIPDWNRSGPTQVAEAPRGLVYLFHYLHGALCCELGRLDLALQLAETLLPRGNRSADAAFLWRLPDLSGWPDLLGGSCAFAWKYVVSLPERFKILEEFFPLRRDFEVGLASYSALLSLLEAAHDSTKLLPLGEERLQQISHLDVPPMFLDMRYEIAQTAFGRTFGSPQVVRQVVERTNVKTEALKQLWPYWKIALRRDHHSIHQDRIFPEDLPLGDLAC